MKTENNITNGCRPVQMHQYQGSVNNCVGSTSNCTGSISKYRGELSECRGEKGPVLTKKEWEDISARAYKYAIKDLKIKRI